MRITFVSPTLNMGGGIKVVAIYAEEMRRRGHTVTIVSPPRHDIPLLDKAKLFLKGRGWYNTKASPSYFDRLELDCRVIESARPVVDADLPDADVVIATWWETAEWVNNLAAEKGAKVYFVQGHEVFPYLPERSRKTYKLPLRKIVVSQWLRDLMRSEYGEDADLVPNSVDRSEFYSPPRNRPSRSTIGLLYSPSWPKGLDVSLNVLKAICGKIPDIRIIAFGNDNLIAELPLPHGGEYFKSPSGSRIRQIYSECTVWLTASRSEGFNLTSMEAMACRTPVVATRTGWPAHAIRSRWNGILADIDDVGAIVQGLEWVLSLSEQKWRSISTNAYATVATSSWTESATMFEEALYHACQRAAREGVSEKI